METAVQRKLADLFHLMHHRDEMLVLPNAWDCVSAKIFEHCGFQAVATTSAGVAWSLGYRDGEQISPEEMLKSVERIAHVLEVPVTADIEGAYIHNSYKKLEEFFYAVIEAGAVGVNIEDRCGGGAVQCDIEYQMDVIALAKEVGRKKGINLFVNARTDSMEVVFGDRRMKAEVCIRRANAFKEAGADGIFIPFVKDIETVELLKSGIDLPLNILITPSLSVSDLKKLKVNRISVGSKPMLAALNRLQKISSEMLQGDEWPSLFVETPPYNEVNNWFPDRSSEVELL